MKRKLLMISAVVFVTVPAGTQRVQSYQTEAARNPKQALNTKFKEIYHNEQVLKKQDVVIETLSKQ